MYAENISKIREITTDRHAQLLLLENKQYPHTLTQLMEQLYNEGKEDVLTTEEKAKIDKAIADANDAYKSFIMTRDTVYDKATKCGTTEKCTAEIVSEIVRYMDSSFGLSEYEKVTCPQVLGCVAGKFENVAANVMEEKLQCLDIIEYCDAFGQMAVKLYQDYHPEL